ncbi:hypothetical protein NP493_590g03081 [Ridgeia piscesae]|uniref:Uncharacterized protein n=1 Tax=Ridgeia piscesae TaxID=27915 RepID=A0AAD9KUH4_RIDPI|nr:hypothetical protein NP493_590g03081 [Ridgeia piscesae]
MLGHSRNVTQGDHFRHVTQADSLPLRRTSGTTSVTYHLGEFTQIRCQVDLATYVMQQSTSARAKEICVGNVARCTSLPVMQSGAVHFFRTAMLFLREKTTTGRRWRIFQGVIDLTTLCSDAQLKLISLFLLML